MNQVLASMKIQMSVFENGMVKTTEGEFVPSRQYFDVMAVLGALMHAAYDVNNREAQNILGDLKTTATGETLFQETTLHIGNLVSRITDGDGKMTEAARQIIQDVLRDDPKTTIGTEYYLATDHYFTQLQARVPNGYHLELSDDRRHVPAVVEGPVPPAPMN